MAAREAARLAEAAAAATTVLDESDMLLRHHRGRIGTLRFTSLRRSGRRQRFSMQLAVVAWARVSGGNDGGFTGSRRFLCMLFLFGANWCDAASIAFGLSGAFMRAAPGIYCGSRIQFHLTRGQLRL